MGMQYDFDTMTDRRNTNCGKWDTMDQKYGRKDMIHLGVADMDFKAPDPILDGLRDVLDMGVLGYTDLSDKFFESIQRWYRKQYGLEIPREWIVFCPRINIASSICVDTYTEKGDGVIMNTPAYGPLQSAIIKNDRRMLSSPLSRNADRYELDFDHMESLVDERTKMLIMCNPHNPTGRSWTKEELIRTAEFCKKNVLILFSGEIHGDLTAEGVKHNTFLSATEDINERLILATSPAKTFNIPGVIVSYMIIPNRELREQIAATIDRIGMHNPTIFAVTAVEKAYTECDEWYEAVKKYIDENEKFTRDYFAGHFEAFHSLPREGTYLLWIDYTRTGMSEEELEQWFLKEANVSVYMGSIFGEAGRGYIRLNLASPRSLLKEAYERMRTAWRF